MRLHMFQNPELLIHDEFNDLLYTDKDITPLFVPFFYKKKIRDKYGQPVPCPSCNNKISGIIEGSNDCPYCEGYGFIFEEGIDDGWFYNDNLTVSRALGNVIDTEMAQEYMYEYSLATRSDIILNEGDIILKPKLLGNAEIQLPVSVNGMYKVLEGRSPASNQSDSEYNIYKLGTIKSNYFRKLLNNE